MIRICDKKEKINLFSILHNGSQGVLSLHAISYDTSTCATQPLPKRRSFAHATSEASSWTCVRGRSLARSKQNERRKKTFVDLVSAMPHKRRKMIINLKCAALRLEASTIFVFVLFRSEKYKSMCHFSVWRKWKFLYICNLSYMRCAGAQYFIIIIIVCPAHGITIHNDQEE